MKNNLNNTIFFASNDGGHFAQLMALHELFGKYDTVIVTDNIRANKDITALKNVKSFEFAMAFANKRKKLTQEKGKKLTKASYLSAYVGLTKECYVAFMKHRPKVVISTGSNIAVPLCIISKLFGAKFVYIETRAKVYTKTLTGKLIGGIADKVIVQWPEMVGIYKGKAEYLGTLV